MNPSSVQIIATILFVFAILHTFLVRYLHAFSKRFIKGSIRERSLRYLSEVEVVFGFWAAVLMFFYTYFRGFNVYDNNHNTVAGAVYYLEHQNFTEPLFVFVIMCMVGTRPITYLAQNLILFISKLIPLPKKMAVYITVMIFGPLFGSLITEPAAMAVTALILVRFFYEKHKSEKFMYTTIGLLFVNVSIGGTLTNFSAPPIIMVAEKWGWDIFFMFTHFGYKSALAIVASTLIAAYLLRDELKGKIDITKPPRDKLYPPIWLSVVHIVFVGLLVSISHHPVVVVALFILFVGFVGVTVKYQAPIPYKESLLVAFFLAGLVTLGSLQDWWLKPLLTQLDSLSLYFGTTGLTAFTDNAALSYLGSLVNLSDAAKYNLIAGALTGGGLTIIANAPNPAGYSILKPYFNEGIKPLSLFKAAIIPTIIAMLAFQLLPNL
jgi:hypothetical protein